MTLDLHFQWLVFFLTLSAIKKFFTAEIWKKKVYYGYFKGHVMIIKSPYIKKTYKSVTYLCLVSVMSINKKKYFHLNQSHLVNILKNYCALSASSRNSTIFLFNMSFQILCFKKTLKRRFVECTLFPQHCFRCRS